MSIATPGMVVLANRVLPLANCIDKVPWLDGQPSDIFYLDDENDLKRAGITLNKALKKSDYYIHWNNRNWSLIERKSGPSRIDIAIEQLKSTIRQLRQQGKPVERLIVISEKLSPNERSTYGRVPQNKSLLFSRKSIRRDGLLVEGISLEFYTLHEVEQMRQQGRIPWR